MNLKRAIQIKGWMKPQELRWIAIQARRCGRIVEVGVYRGRTTRAILDNSSASVWCVDNWDHTWPGGIIDRSDHERFVLNIQDKHGRVNILYMDSDEAARELLDTYGESYFDMAFIDGGHDYETVKSDIALYTPLVKRGGLICGDDYSKKAWPGVVRAVNEAFGKPQRHHAIWWIEKDG